MNAGAAGLDMTALRRIAAQQRGPGRYRHLLDRIGAHLDEHGGFVSWSGGKDSTTVVDMVRQVDPHVPVVLFDTGLLFPETVHYMQDLAQQWRLNFHPIATEPDLLTMLAAGGGFDHKAVDRPLRGRLADIMITRPAAAAHARFGRGSMWGVRGEESAGRRRLYRSRLAVETRVHDDLSREAVRAAHGGVVYRNDGTVTYGPIWDWRPPRVFEYLAGRCVPLNPLYEKLARLGVPEDQIRVDSMIDAALLSNGHCAWLMKGWPLLFDRIATEVLPRLPEWT